MDLDTQLIILNHLEETGAGFFSRVGDKFYVNVSGAHGNDPNQWSNANALVEALGTSVRNGPTPDWISGHLVIEVSVAQRKAV